MKYRLGLSGEDPRALSDSMFDGVGLLRGEYIVRRAKHYVTSSVGADALRDYLRRVCSAVAPKRVCYRLIELETIEANVLQGVDQIVDEEVPMMGCRGARRALRLPAALAVEADIIADVAASYQNLEVIVPFVTDERDVRTIMMALRHAGFAGRIASMIEIPSAALRVEHIIAEGVSEVLIGMNDLVSLLLGAERGTAYHDCLHPAVWALAEDVLRRAADNHVPCGVAGYLPVTALRLAEAAGYDFAVVHYAMLPATFGPEYEQLPDLGLMQSTKTWTKQAIKQRAWAMSSAHDQAASQ